MQMELIYSIREPGGVALEEIFFLFTLLSLQVPG